MSKELTVKGEALGASLEGTLAAELFLKENYLFRFNELSGKTEFVKLPVPEGKKKRLEGADAERPERHYPACQT